MCILTKTKIIFIVVLGGKTTSHVLFWTLFLWLAQSRMCVCVCKIWYYHYARLWLFMYQDWRTNCYYIKTIYQENVSRHARRDPPSSLEHNVMIWVFNCLVQNQIKCNVFSDVFKGRGRLLSCKLGCHFLVNTTS